MQSLIDYLSPTEFVSDLFAVTILAGALMGIQIPTKSKIVFWVAVVALVLSLALTICAMTVANHDIYGVLMTFVLGIGVWAIITLLSGMLALVITGTICDALEERKR